MTHRFEIRIRGELNSRWSQWFADLGFAVEGQDGDIHQTTTLRCSDMDQARLRGILNTLWDLNMEVISVQRLAEPSTDADSSGQ